MRKPFFCATAVVAVFICGAAFIGCDSADKRPAAESVAVSVAVETSKTEYLLGEKVNPDDLSLLVTYDDGSTSVASADEYTIDAKGFGTFVPCEGEVIVTLKGTALSASYPVRAVRAKTSFKVLAIGNSFSQDCLAHLYALADEAGAENIVLANMYIGGCTLQRHANNMRNDINAYQYQKNTDGTWKNFEGKSLLFGIKDEQWDVITLQQASGDSGMIDTYNQDLADLLQFVYINRPSARTNVVWNMTWAYQADSDHADFAKYNNSQSEMYAAIKECVEKKIKSNKLIQYVIPTGCVIQTLREGIMGDTLTRDGYHLSYKQGRYAGGMTWLKHLTGWNIGGLKCEYAGLTDDELSEIKNAVNR